jgi:hypothetical protein
MSAVTVVVAAPFVVFVDGKRYGPNERVEAPKPLADQWLATGWVVPSKAQQPRKRGMER